MNLHACGELAAWNGVNDLQVTSCFALFGDSTTRGLELSAIHWVVCGIYN